MNVFNFSLVLSLKSITAFYYKKYEGKDAVIFVSVSKKIIIVLRAYSVKVFLAKFSP